jgi:chromosome partitioning protein
MTRYVGTTNQKGGVGKTAITIGVGAAWAEQGKKVLLVDLDPSGHTTRALKWGVELETNTRIAQSLPVTDELQQLAAIEQEEIKLAAQEQRDPELQELYSLDGPNLFQALIPEAAPPIRKGRSRPEITPEQVIRVLPGEGFHLLPAHEEMTALQQWLSNVSNREERLWNFLAQIKGYDIVMLDSPPDLGPITDSVLFVARAGDKHGVARPGDAGVIVPIEADDESLNALDQLWAQIATLEQVMQIHIDILTVIPNKYEDGRLSSDILRDLRQALPEEVIAPFEIRKRNVVRKAYRAGQSIFSYWPTDHKERHLQKDVLDLRGWYTQLADLIVARLDELAVQVQVRA